jgi:pyridoxal phosphate enzyme (YggS family)
MNIISKRFIKITLNNIYKQNLKFSKMELSTSLQNDTIDNDTTINIESNNSIINNAKYVKDKIYETAILCDKDPLSIDLIAVSKTKPASDILTLYNTGHRKFGENYFQELLDKAASLPVDIEWHFIGHLQSQKASKLIREVSNLTCIETIDSIKLALKLNSACEAIDRNILYIYIQVDTSGEDTKSGIIPDDLVNIVKEICEKCPRLRIKGLMTIGAPGDMTCFERLYESRNHLIESMNNIEKTYEFPNNIDDLVLSMGMSVDFEEAIKRGSTSVRVGSTIFGARDYSNIK